MTIRFDFAGALELAVGLSAIADGVEQAAAERAKLRDVALDPTEFQGPYGERHREYADEEDHALKATEACRDAADDWAAAWTSAVDAHNNQVESNARARMRRYNQIRQDRWRLLRLNDPEGYHPYPVMGRVHATRPATTPVGSQFDGGDAFAQYSFDFNDLDAYPTYSSAP